MPVQDSPKVANDARDFGGIMLSDNASDLEAGEAQDQLNLKSDQVGSAHVRLGMLPVSFDS